MRPKSRKVTRQLLDAIDEGLVSQQAVLHACLNYMSEAQVADMCEIKGFLEFEELDEGLVIDEL